MSNAVIDESLSGRIHGSIYLMPAYACRFGKFSIGQTGGETLAKILLKSSSIEHILVPELPKKHDCIHLDMMLSMTDHHLCCLSKHLLEHVDGAWKIYLDPHIGALKITKSPNFLALLKQHLDSTFEIVNVDHPEAGLQANCATNLLTLTPGVVIGYAHNHYANQRLTERGIQVITLPGSQLVLGHGGPHCMSCPVNREALPDQRYLSCP